MRKARRPMRVADWGVGTGADTRRRAPGRAVGPETHMERQGGRQKCRRGGGHDEAGEEVSGVMDKTVSKQEGK